MADAKVGPTILEMPVVLRIGGHERQVGTLEVELPATGEQVRLKIAECLRETALFLEQNPNGVFGQ